MKTCEVINVIKIQCCYSSTKKRQNNILFSKGGCKKKPNPSAKSEKINPNIKHFLVCLSVSFSPNFHSFELELKGAIFFLFGGKASNLKNNSFSH